MFLGSSDPTPYDIPVTTLLVFLGVVLLAGSLSGHYWSSEWATVIRRTVGLLAFSATLFVLVATPSHGSTVVAGRLITLFPAAFANAVLFVFWSWRAGGL